MNTQNQRSFGAQHALYLSRPALVLELEDSAIAVGLQSGRQAMEALAFCTPEELRAVKNQAHLIQAIAKGFYRHTEDTLVRMEEDIEASVPPAVDLSELADAVEQDNHETNMGTIADLAEKAPQEPVKATPSYKAGDHILVTSEAYSAVKVPAKIINSAHGTDFPIHALSARGDTLFLRLDEVKLAPLPLVVQPLTVAEGDLVKLTANTASFRKGETARAVKLLPAGVLVESLGCGPKRQGYALSVFLESAV